MPSCHRIPILFLVIMLLIVTASNSIAADDKKPHIFMNTASDIGAAFGDNYGMVKFAEIARNVGFTVDHGVHPDLVTNSPLEGIDVYILFSPNFPFTDQDKVALRQWVRAGGVLITADYFYSSVVSRFLEEFGVEFGPFGWPYRDMKLVPGSPLSGPRKINNLITSSCRNIYILDPTRSEAILKYDDGNVAISRTISHAGKGEIIATPCFRSFLDDAITGYIGREDNAKLVENLLRYIKGKFSDSAESSFDLSMLTVKFKKGTVFLPGDEIKLIARIKNIGTEQSESTRVAFYIETVGVATSAITEIASTTVSSINAKKKIKIVKKAYLPDDLEAGNYVIHAYVDPDSITADSNTINNSETAKKFLVIQ